MSEGQIGQRLYNNLDRPLLKTSISFILLVQLQVVTHSL